MNELAVLYVLMSAPSIMDNDVQNHASQVTPNKSTYEVCLFVQIIAEGGSPLKHFWCQPAPINTIGE